MTFDRRLAREIAPFGATALLAFAIVPIQNRVEWTGYALAGTLAVAILVATVIAPWRTLPRALRVVPSLLFLVALALLRDAGGGAIAGVGALALLPVFWLALHGSRTQLLVVMAAAFGFFLAPVLVTGGTQYPMTVWRVGVVFTAASGIVGIAVQNLVGRVRSHAEALAVRERDLEAMAELSRTLAGTADARERICSAACDLSGARVAVLFEAQTDGALAPTASAGLRAPAATVTAEADASWVMAAYASRAPLLTTDPHEHADANRALLHAAGAPGAILCEPVRRGQEAVGVLVVGWDRAPSDPRRAGGLVSLLASEAAFVIERADLLGRLTQMALTDELTGLPNRRAWDERLERAIRDAEPVCVAMLDLDFFKAFNDHQGHQAGDRLLKEAAAAWRAELRQTDVLARYGGEEFTVLLGGRDLEAARRTVDRLRAATPQGQSCSAGLARPEPGEDGAALIGRADEALYDAKRAGRNSTSIAAGAAVTDG
jgi:diguanylate cyclase (GGDEF)-like protein